MPGLILDRAYIVLEVIENHFLRLLLIEIIRLF